jgi:hypothetical protein
MQELRKVTTIISAIAGIAAGKSPAHPLRKAIGSRAVESAAKMVQT